MRIKFGSSCQVRDLPRLLVVKDELRRLLLLQS